MRINQNTTAALRIALRRVSLDGSMALNRLYDDAAFTGLQRYIPILKYAVEEQVPESIAEIIDPPKLHAELKALATTLAAKRHLSPQACAFAVWLIAAAMDVHIKAPVRKSAGRLSTPKPVGQAPLQRFTAGTRSYFKWLVACVVLVTVLSQLITTQETRRGLEGDNFVSQDTVEEVKAMTSSVPVAPAPSLPAPTPHLSTEIPFAMPTKTREDMRFRDAGAFASRMELPSSPPTSEITAAQQSPVLRNETPKMTGEANDPLSMTTRREREADSVEFSGRPSSAETPPSTPPFTHILEFHLPGHGNDPIRRLVHGDVQPGSLVTVNVFNQEITLQVVRELLIPTKDKDTAAWLAVPTAQMPTRVAVTSR